MELVKILLKGAFSPVKTLYLNFKALPFGQAKRLPIIVSRRVKINGLKKNSIEIHGKVNTGMISMGFGGSPDLIPYNPKASYLEIKNDGKLIFEGKAHFAPHFSVLVGSSAVMRVGKGFSCNNGCVFSCMKKIEFEENCLVGGSVTVRDSDGHTVYSLDENNERTKAHPTVAPVHIGAHVWLCNKCDVLKGVTIGSDCIVAYNSTVTSPVEGDHLLIGGYPAKVIKTNITWER